MDFSSSLFGGSVTGMMINVNDGDGTFATGAISGTTVSGTSLNEEAEDGGWMGSTTECLAES